MPLSTWNLQWLNHNSQRAYPLSEEASRTDITGSFVLPDNVILAMYLPVHAGLDVNPASFFLRSVAVFASGINISIGYDDGSPDPKIVASASVDVSSHKEYQSYALSGIGDFDDIAGKIVLGHPDAIKALPPGRYIFSPEAGRLDTDVIRPIIRGVSSIVLVSGQDRTNRLYGDIELVAGSNIRLTATTENGVTKIRIDAISGEGLNDDCECEEENKKAPCIRSINGIRPNPDGTLTFIGDKCLEIVPITGGLKFSDKCSDPCCGCEELEAITRDLEKFGQAATLLTNFLNRLEAQVNTMALHVLGSRLGDKGCRS